MGDGLLSARVEGMDEPLAPEPGEIVYDAGEGGHEQRPGIDAGALRWVIGVYLLAAAIVGWWAGTGG